MTRQDTIDRPRPTHSLQREEWTCQVTERNRPSKAHSLAGDSRGRDFSGHGRKLTDRGPLTSWRRQREEFVRTQKATDLPMPTHFLMTAGGTGQDMKRNRPCKARLHPGDGRGMKLVRTWKETDRPRPTHSLETAEGGNCQDMERNRPINAHLHPGDNRRRDLSGHRNRPSEAHSLPRDGREGIIRTWKEADRPSPTHQLEMVEGGTCQDMERNRPTEAYSLSGDGRGRDLSGSRKKPADRGPLTSWRRQREKLVRTRKETERPKSTHQLETVEEGTCQYTERNRPTEAHPLPADGRRRDLSGYECNPTE